MRGNNSTVMLHPSCSERTAMPQEAPRPTVDLSRSGWNGFWCSKALWMPRWQNNSKKTNNNKKNKKKQQQHRSTKQTKQTKNSQYCTRHVCSLNACKGLTVWGREEGGRVCSMHSVGIALFASAVEVCNILYSKSNQNKCTKPTVAFLLCTGALARYTTEAVSARQITSGL